MSIFRPLISSFQRLVLFPLLPTLRLSQQFSISIPLLLLTPMLHHGVILFIMILGSFIASIFKISMVSKMTPMKWICIYPAWLNFMSARFAGRTQDLIFPNRLFLKKYNDLFDVICCIAKFIFIQFSPKRSAFQERVPTRGHFYGIHRSMGDSEYG